MIVYLEVKGTGTYWPPMLGVTVVPRALQVSFDTAPASTVLLIGVCAHAQLVMTYQPAFQEA